MHMQIPGVVLAAALHRGPNSRDAFVRMCQSVWVRRSQKHLGLAHPGFLGKPFMLGPTNRAVNALGAIAAAMPHISTRADTRAGSSSRLCNRGSRSCTSHRSHRRNRILARSACGERNSVRGGRDRAPGQSAAPQCRERQGAAPQCRERQGAAPQRREQKPCRGRRTPLRGRHHRSRPRERRHRTRNCKSGTPQLHRTNRKADQIKAIQINPHSPDNVLSFGVTCAIQI